MKLPTLMHRSVSIVWVLLLSLSGCSSSPSPMLEAPLQPQLPPLPQDPAIQVYFNQVESSVYQESARQVERYGDDLEKIIVDTIASAKTSVAVAVQELQLPKIAQALANQYQAGVKVRVVLENLYHVPWSELTVARIEQLPPRERERYEEYRNFADVNKDGELSQVEIEQGDALLILGGAGVPVIDDTADGSQGSGLMHHKFVIVDDQILLVTSANFTPSDMHGDWGSAASRGNPNNLLKIQSPELTRHFAEEFNLLWGDGPEGQSDSRFGVQKPFRPVQQLRVGQTQIAVQFSPTSRKYPWEQSVNGLISQTLATASESVDLALFVFSEQQIANTLALRHQQGVKIRGLIERGFAYRPYSEGLDMMGVALAENCQFDPNNRPWQTPLTTVGVANLPPGDRLHHKFAVVDGKTVITGSHNWSATANINNDETLLVLENPVIAAHFIREFERLYRDAILGVPGSVKAKIAQQVQECGTALAPMIPPSSADLRSQVINVNTATQKELETLPGIGPKLAERLILTREQQPFSSLEDLMRVPGIGPKTLESLQERVTG